MSEVRRKRLTWLEVVAGLFWRNWLTLFGASVATASAFLIIAFVLAGIVGVEQPPYVGIIAFLIMPGVFVFGLLLIPLGAYLDRRKRARTGIERVEAYPKLDFNNPRTRRGFVLIAFLTLVNVFIISSVAYQGVVYTESVQFCGQVCHTVMEPEHTAYLNSPHSRVKCVECHIGPGAPWFVKSKLSGVGQVFAVLFNTYEHPIPTPVENLRPSRDTCEECHWPERFTGDKVKVVPKFTEDEANTKLTSVLLMHIGGGNSGHPGIHSWHIDPNKKTYYYARDDRLEDIVWVKVEMSDGTVHEFRDPEAELPATGPPADEIRLMDCIDCHNRPTHIYEMPGTAMDKSLAAGRIDPTLPYIKMIGVQTLQEVADEKAGPEAIDERVRGYYQENYPDVVSEREEALAAAIAELKSIYGRNVFPNMDVTWGTYPNHIGHVEFTGCFRCHDDSMSTGDGQTISQDCTICHTVLAWDEEEPEIIQQLGL